MFEGLEKGWTEERTTSAKALLASHLGLLAFTVFVIVFEPGKIIHSGGHKVFLKTYELALIALNVLTILLARKASRQQSN